MKSFVFVTAFWSTDFTIEQILAKNPKTGDITDLDTLIKGNLGHPTQSILYLHCLIGTFHAPKDKNLVRALLHNMRGFEATILERVPNHTVVQVKGTPAVVSELWENTDLACYISL